MPKNKILLIGYSGHAYVICDILLSQGFPILGYCESNKKVSNPYSLKYYGSENLRENIERISKHSYCIAVGDNNIRNRIYGHIQAATGMPPINVIHKKASVSITSLVGHGVMIGDGCIINACSLIANGVICNTQSVIEHQCKIGAFCHIAPGAILCANVDIGENTLIGAGAVIKPGIKIGNNVVVGAGTVIIKDISSNKKVVGNPQKYI